jgi:Ca-activated chloride channel family protein
MNDLVWGDPGAARWGLLVIALLFGFIWLGLWRRRRMTDLAKVGPLPSLLDAARPGRLVLRGALVLGAALLLVMALMRPQQGTRATELKNLGIDIAVVLDASKSMKVADVVPDRLQAAKLEIHKLLDGMHGGRVGLVPFAGLAFIQTPLTSDFDVIGTYLDDLEVEDMPRGGTAIGRALIEAIRSLVPPEQLEGTLAESGTDPADGPAADRDTDAAAFTGSKFKAIVLFTDGEGHEGEPLAVAELAAKLGIRIFTVGVGTAQGRPVPLINAEGQVMGTVKARDGATPMFSELNERLLREIAVKTGGDYFHLGPAGGLQRLRKSIDTLEKQEYDATFKHLRDDRFQLAVIPALLLLILEALLSGRRRRRKEHA